MFNLEAAILEWRRQMLSAGIKTPVPLDELENHLRDDVEQRIRSGFSEQQAFDAAVRQVGCANGLKAEFQKIRATAGRNQMIQTIVILTALFGTVFGGAMMLPALGRWHQAGILIWWPLVVGAVLVVVAGWGALYGIRRHRVAQGKNLISIGAIAAGAFYVVPLIQSFFVQKADLAGWIFCAVLAVVSVSFYGTCLHFNRRLSSPPAAPGANSS
jgi:cation transport ATPase